MKVVKALLVWLISIPVCAIAWVVSFFYFIFVIPIKEYNKVLYGDNKKKVVVREITKDQLRELLNLKDEKKDNDKKDNDTTKMS